MKKDKEWAQKEVDRYLSYEEVVEARNALIFAKGVINQLDEPETITEEWIRENEEQVDPNNPSNTWWVEADKLSGLLVPKQDKPVIPQFVVDYYNDYEKYELTFAEWFEFPEFGNEGKIANKTFEWLLDNSHEVNIERQFILADIIAHGLNGYEVEKEKKYRVVIKTTDSNLALWQATDGSGDTDFISLDRITTGKRTFTESEIKAIDERYLAFKEEVTE